MFKNITNYFNTLTAVILSQLTKFLKINLMLGSKAIFFTASNIFLPLIGKFSNPLAILAIFSLQALFTVAFGSVNIILNLPMAIISLYHIPTLCAALYLTDINRLFKILLPLLAIAIFITHPIGSQAYWYSFYWFIPAAIALIHKPNFFLQALGSTFTAHAVGSILWLYTHNLDASAWGALVSVVWAERLMIALGMTVAYELICPSTRPMGSLRMTGGLRPNAAVRAESGVRSVRAGSGRLLLNAAVRAESGGLLSNTAIKADETALQIKHAFVSFWSCSK